MTIAAIDVTKNAEDALMELSMFFIRHGQALWPSRLAPTLEALKKGDTKLALEFWGKMALMGEYGLMQTKITYDDGYRVPDMDAEQVHFEVLLQQALDTMNNLRHYIRLGSNKPLVTIVVDRPL